MSLKGKTAALSVSLFAVFAAQGAGAEPFTLANYSKAKGGNIALTMLAAGSKARAPMNFATVKKHAKDRKRAIPAASGFGHAARLKHLIGRVEAGRDGYDAVQFGARIRPGKPPTQMTIGEIFQWIRATPGQQHAIGRYQFIPATLKALVQQAGLSSNTVFSQQVQDHLADFLLEDAGYDAFLEGRISRHRFMENLAMIWAGFPTSTGRSYYHGQAGNRAVITWHEFDAHMLKIAKDRRG